jgi:TrmH family RNA methyltransferase
VTDTPKHPPILDQIAVVLVRPMGDGNVGQIARAIRNFGMSRLLIVDPQFKETEHLRQMAVGAYQLIKDAEIHPTLADALKDFHYVVGTSRRLGKFRKRFSSSRALPGWLLPKLTGGHTAALVFGNEAHGLSKAEMDQCNEIVEVITDPGYRSLNLAQAVLILGYELFSHAAEAPLAITKHEPANYADMRRLYDHMREIYFEIGFLDLENPERNMRHLRRIFSRAAPSEQEVRVLQGILSDTMWYIKHVEETGKRDGYREMVGDSDTGNRTQRQNSADRPEPESAEQVGDADPAADTRRSED